jgi:sulfur-oxidizing protein SoxY
MLTISRSFLLHAVVASLAFLGLAFAAQADDAENNEVWQGLRKDVFGTRQIEDGAGKLKLETPIRAEDAAVVPITVTMPKDFAPNVKKLTLIIDKNPMPVVGTFTYGPAAGNGERTLATRVRINQYSDVRAVAETEDGKLYMVANFVKASGGCSAPASKDPDAAAKLMGKMKIKTAIDKTSDDGLTHVAQIAIKHPNNSGLQMDQLTGLYTPARYINKVEVKTGDKLIFSLEGGISFSEDPNIRFSYEGNPADPMTVTAEDSDGTHFAGQSAPNQS